MILTELPCLVGNHLSEIVMATCPAIGRTGKEGHDVVQVRVINLAGLREKCQGIEIKRKMIIQYSEPKG